MNFESPRLYFKALQQCDLPIVSNLYQTPGVMKYIGELYTKENAEKQFDLLLKHNDKKPYQFLTWCVREKGNSTFMGIISLIQKDRPEKAPEMGIMFLPQVSGKGYATEAVKATAIEGFQQYGADSIVANTLLVNIAAQKVLEHAHFAFSEETFDTPLGLSKRATIYRKKWKRIKGYL